MSGAPRTSVLRGLTRIAFGKADGLIQFGATPQSYLTSLAPLLAFPVAGSILALFNQGLQVAFTDLAVSLCAVLTPAVVSYELARFWGKADGWARFVTVFNWCEWVLLLVLCLLMVPIGVAIAAGVPAEAATLGGFACLGIYGMWLHWFLARKALRLSAWRSVALVLIVNFTTAALVILPLSLVSKPG
jgi:hypothetical protein